VKMSSEGAPGEADAREDVEAEAAADASNNNVESDPPSTSTIPAADAAETCSICLDEPPSAPCKTKCGHIFCRDCFLQTLKRDRPWNRGKCPLCRAVVTVYSTLDLASDAPLGVPDVDTIFGSVYLQGGSIGQASYHFDAPDHVYISYENAPGKPPTMRPYPVPTLFFFFFTLVTGPRSSLSLNLSDTRVYQHASTAPSSAFHDEFSVRNRDPGT